MTTDPVMRTEALLTLTRWLSPSYPVGGFAWSHGLEAAVSEGLVATPADLEDWLDTVLRHGAGRNDVILLAESWRADTPEEVVGIAELASALAPSKERLAETLQQGGAFARVTRETSGLVLPEMPYPVAVGRAARLCELPLEPAAQVFVQAMLSNMVQAALRLMPLGQTEGAALLERLTGRSAPLVSETTALTLEDLGSACFAVDAASMRHETQGVRIFRS